MKKMALVDEINNAWAVLVLGENEEEEMDVHLGTLYQFIKSEIQEDEFLEVLFADDQKTIIGAQKLIEETRKRRKEAIARHNRLLYGTSKGVSGV